MRRATWLTGVLALAAVAASADEAQPPNLVLIYADDLGYADIGPFGARGYATPCLDRMAREGRRFTDFYVAQAVCSASRAALMTGCYSNRVGILGALGPRSAIGIHPDEHLLPEAIQQKGYATAAIGKWHLGDGPAFSPLWNGFGEYFGLPYSNDMWPHHPERPDAYPPLPLIDGERVVETNPDQRQLTRRYTERAVRFIESNSDRPFFLYLAHSMPHVPLHASESFAGRSGGGLLGDVMAEIDWSVGQVLDALTRNGLDDRTLVIFASDNGPWLSYGDHAGSAAPLREGKGTSFEGGVRVPCLMRWPGRIAAGTECREPVMTIDLLPTLCALVGAKLPPDRPIDGADISTLIDGKPGARSPHEVLAFYWGNELQAVRSGRWKLHFPHTYRTLAETGSGGQPGRYVEKRLELSLYDLESDPGESTDVAALHPEEVARLQALADPIRTDLGDSLSGRVGSGVRPPGRMNRFPSSQP